jgi:hypothetical protein
LDPFVTEKPITFVRIAPKDSPARALELVTRPRPSDALIRAIVAECIAGAGGPSPGETRDEAAKPGSHINQINGVRANTMGAGGRQKNRL